MQSVSEFLLVVCCLNYERLICRTRKAKRKVCQVMKRLVVISLTLFGASILSSMASSHREAPGITKVPQLDSTDFYMFRSYEPGRENYVTLIANYNPFQHPAGGPNFYPLDPAAKYEIHIDNNGDAVEDLTFSFRFFQESPFLSLEVGNPGSEINVPVALSNVDEFGPGVGGENALNVIRSYGFEGH